MNFNSDFIEELKCQICDNYLSHFPIYTNEKQENICGRCPIKKSTVYVKNNVYEIVARQIQFPCQFVQQGCFERLVPKDIPYHEKQCPFRTVSCPTKTFTGCSVSTSFPNLKRHCEDNHSDVFLRNGKFEIKLWKSEKVSHLVQNGSCFSELSWRYNLDSKKLRCSISLLEDSQNISYFYSIILKNDSRVLTLTGCLGKGTTESEIHKVPLDCLTDSSCYTDTIEGYIHIDKEQIPQARPIDENLLNLFKCVSCHNYIKPPVSIYLNGQSKCNRCCSSGLITNNCLDNIASLMTYPCKFSENGCKYIARPLLMQDHESCCRYSNTQCPINGYYTCNWTGLGKDINQHILENHNTIIKNSSEISENVTNAITVCYFIRHLNNFFRLTFCYNNDYYNWALQVIQKVDDNLKYEIEVLDSNNNNKKLVIRQNCVPLTSRNLVLKNVDTHCFFTRDQIKSLVSTEKVLTYRIRIFK